MATHKEEAVPVKAIDVLSLAMSAAEARIEEMKGKAGLTLIDRISVADWAAWDGADEKALVIDPCGIDAHDPCDDDEEVVKAA